MSIDGQNVYSSLFQIIRNTEKYSNQNNIIKFSDNSSAIEEFLVHVIRPIIMNLVDLKVFYPDKI